MIVSVMDTVLAEGHHVTYENYINTKGDEFIETYDQEKGRHFAVFKRKTAVSEIR